jgi:hypothetical protein
MEYHFLKHGKSHSISLPEVPIGYKVRIVSVISNLWNRHDYAYDTQSPQIKTICKNYLHVGNGKLKYISWSKK